MGKSLIMVRRAEAADGPVFLNLVEALAAYENLAPPDPAARARLLRDAFGPQPRFMVLLAHHGAEPVGYVALLEMYSTFLAKPTLFIEDIFVLEHARRLGVGEALFKTCVQEALGRDCGRMEWLMLDWNQKAQRFYERMGAKVNKEWVHFRMTREQMEALPV